MRNDPFYRICLGIAALLGVIHLFNGNVGSTERIVIDEIADYKTELGWESLYDVGESMIAGVSYHAHEESGDCECDAYVNIYVNRPGFSFGWFFRYGGNLLQDYEYVKRIVIDGIDDFALVSANELRVCRIEIDDGTEIQICPIDPNQPFVMVLPGSTAGYTLYDENDGIVPVP